MYKLSLIIPIYKVEMYIEECIVSVINQIQPEIQVICINDGSPDDSMNIAKSVVSRYEAPIQQQFLFIDQENKGLSEARNTGLVNALGEYIGFLDSDDKLSPDYIEDILQVINSGNFDIIDFNLITSTGEIRQIRQGDQTTLESVFRAGFWYSCARVFKRNMFDNYRFTPGIYYEDLALTPILYTEAKISTHINKPLYWYRVNADGITLNQSIESNIKTISSFEYVLDQYIKLYIASNNKYYAYALMQSYYLLCTSASLRFSSLESFKIVNKHKLLKRQVISDAFISTDRALKRRVHFFYKYPRTYLTAFNTIYRLLSLKNNLILLLKK